MKKIKTSPFVPNEFEVEQISDNEANIIAYPFETGYAISLAHPLRRFLLSSSMGYAPVALKVEGASHEFDSVRGMLEDISEFILNLKNVRFRLSDEVESVEVTYNFSGSKEITGADLNSDSVECVTPDAFLATLNEDAEVTFSIIIYRGMGYVASEDIREEIPEGYIPMDAYFTPVRKVTYTIEHVLVEDNPEFEKIVMNIKTDGQIDPLGAFQNALSVMKTQMSVFSQDVSDSPTADTGARSNDSDELKIMIQKIEELGLSARSFNCLDRSGIHYIGEISSMSENELKNVKNLGKKSLDEIKDKLVEFGQPVGSITDENTIEQFKKKIEAQA